VPALTPIKEKIAEAAPLDTVPDVTVPIVVVPCLTVKVTVPSLTAAVEGLFAVTLALSVTLPWLAVPLVLEAVVVVPALLTTCVTGEDVLAPNVLVTPAYDAVNVCDPAVSVENCCVAVPLTRVAVPICVLPSRKVTVPPFGVVGPVICATVAARVID